MRDYGATNKSLAVDNTSKQIDERRKITDNNNPNQHGRRGLLRQLLTVVSNARSGSRVGAHDAFFSDVAHAAVAVTEAGCQRCFGAVSAAAHAALGRAADVAVNRRDALEAVGVGASVAGSFWAGIFPQRQVQLSIGAEQRGHR